MDAKLSEFVVRQSWECRLGGIEVELVNEPSVWCGGLECNGVFDGDERSLRVAVAKPESVWLPTFIHESCHFDQWNENSSLFFHKVGGYDPTTIVDMWLAAVVELLPFQKRAVIGATLAIELDCERRAVEKIEANYLEPYINLDEYIQKANAYIFFYLVVEIKRQWYAFGKAPYMIESIWRQMPTSFLDDDQYQSLPDGYLELFEPCFKD